MDEPVRVMTVDDAAIFRAVAHELIAATEGFEPVLRSAPAKRPSTGRSRSIRRWSSSTSGCRAWTGSKPVSA